MARIVTLLRKIFRVKHVEAQAKVAISYFTEAEQERMFKEWESQAVVERYQTAYLEHCGREDDAEFWRSRER